MNKLGITILLSVMFVFIGPASALILISVIYLGWIILGFFKALVHHFDTNYSLKCFVMKQNNQVNDEMTEFAEQAVSLRKKIADARFEIIN